MGFNMVESELVREWKTAARTEGKTEGKIEWLVQVVEGCFGSVPEDVATSIRRCQDAAQLDRWLKSRSEAVKKSPARISPATEVTSSFHRLPGSS